MRGRKILITQIESTVLQILNMQGTEEDSKAMENIIALKELLVKKENSMFNPLAVDHRLRNEYKFIEKLEKNNSKEVNTQISGRRLWYNDIINRLNNDLIGIYVEMAIEHKILSSIDDIEYTDFLCIK